MPFQSGKQKELPENPHTRSSVTKRDHENEDGRQSEDDKDEDECCGDLLSSHDVQYSKPYTTHDALEC